MKRLIPLLLALAAGPGALLAQNIVGSWQGSLQGPAGRPPLRLVVKITRADNESLKAVLYSIDQNPQPISASAVTQQGPTLKMTVAAIGGEFEGKMTPEGDSILGTWSQGGGGVPFTLARATPSTAWEIPDPPPPPKLMPADAHPTFEVATIKPSRPDQPGQSILVGRGGTNLFTTTNTTLNDLIVFAYGMHARQVTAGPSWADADKYDLSAKPDQAGIPNVTQLQSMVQKLLEERFQLTFHREKKELSVYAITIAKSGVKMSKSDPNAGALPGFGGRGPGSIAVRNSTMPEFATFLQSRILDRPVVDQTALKEKFDFTLRWTPDTPPPNSVAGAAGGNATPPAPALDAPPDLFAAVQQQLGLKFESTKAPVEVMVIDKAEKPSEN